MKHSKMLIIRFALLKYDYKAKSIISINQKMLFSGIMKTMENIVKEHLVLDGKKIIKHGKLNSAAQTSDLLKNILEVY